MAVFQLWLQDSEPVQRVPLHVGSCLSVVRLLKADSICNVVHIESWELQSQVSKHAKSSNDDDDSWSDDDEMPPLFDVSTGQYSWGQYT